MCEIFSRVCGFLRPVDVYDPVNGFRVGGWNKGKREEFRQRKTYDPSKQTPPERGSAAMKMALVEEGVLRA